MTTAKTVKFSDRLATTTALQSRLQLFQPTCRPKLISRHVETPWGNATVVGKTGQSHANVMEAVFSQAHMHRQSADGLLQILIDPYRLRLVAGGGRKMSHQHLHTIFRELVQAQFEVSNAALKMDLEGRFIDKIRISKIPVETKNSRYVGNDRVKVGERHYLLFEVGRALTSLIHLDLPLHYDPMPIAALQTGIGMAVARHVKTHRNVPNGGWILDRLLGAVGGATTVQQRRDQKAALALDAAGLLAVGVTIKDGRVEFAKKALQAP